MRVDNKNDNGNKMFEKKCNENVIQKRKEKKKSKHSTLLSLNSLV